MHALHVDWWFPRLRASKVAEHGLWVLEVLSSRIVILFSLQNGDEGVLGGFSRVEDLGFGKVARNETRRMYIFTSLRGFGRGEHVVCCIS